MPDTQTQQSSPQPEATTLPQATTEEPSTIAGSIFNNLAALELRDVEEAAGLVEAVRTYVPVRKPSREQFFRIHPGPEYQLRSLVLELKEEGETQCFALEAINRGFLDKGLLRPPQQTGCAPVQ